MFQGPVKMGSRPSKVQAIVTSDVKIFFPHQGASESSSKSDEFSVTEESIPPDLIDPLLVIAIDFGTTYSGYAFSFKGHKGKILTKTHGYTLCDDRIPTIVLLNPDKTFNSFGYEAQDTYSKLGEEKQTYFYCENFKIAFYKSKQEHVEIRDSRNRRVTAKEVMVMLIENVIQLAFEIADQLRKEDISWILSVPANWSDTARRIIHQSVVSAGINENNIRFVLEPYVASLYCMRTKMHILHTAGYRYILVDLGGFSADICVYEVTAEKKLKELYRATKENVAGLSVDSQFKNLIKELVGEPVWSDFQEHHTSYYQDFMRDFERKKRLFTDNKDTVTMSIENSLVQVLERETGESMEDAIKKRKLSDKIQFRPAFNKIFFTKEIIEELFKPSVDGILGLLENSLKECHHMNLQDVFLVGGYSESPYMREKVKSRFSNLNIVFPDDAKMAVLKGAVLFGYDGFGSEIQSKYSNTSCLAR